MKNRKEVLINHRHRFIVMLIFAVTLCINVGSVLGKTLILDQFYFVSVHNQTQTETIWEANGTNSDLRAIMRVQRNDSETTPLQKFSPNELRVLNDANTFNISAHTPGITRIIEGIWLLDEARLLGLTINRICDRPLEGCFGYYEFLAIDAVTGYSTSLLKIDIHDPVVNAWKNCSVLSAVVIGNVLINPSPRINQFAFTVFPKDSCQGYQRQAEVRIVDYSTLPPTVTTLSKTHGISWSPDGQNLAYFTRENCAAQLCDTAIRTATTTAPTLVYKELYRGSQYYLQPLFVTWLDNRTVIYSALKEPGTAEQPLSTFWSDIVDHSQGTFPVQWVFVHSQVYRLEDQGISNLIATKYPEMSTVGFSSQRINPTVVDLPLINGLFYNSRFNHYAFTLIQGTTINLIDAELDQSTIRLVHFDAIAPNETIIWLVPGSTLDSARRDE